MAVSSLNRRATDGNGLTLSGAQIAGIVVGIVVACLILLGLLIWRLISFRSNRDFFTGRRKNLPHYLQRGHGHIRSTRRTGFVSSPLGREDRDSMYGDEKRLVSREDQPYEREDAADYDIDLSEGERERMPPHKAYNMSGDESSRRSVARHEADQTASTSRQSRWWPYGNGGSIRGESSQQHGQVVASRSGSNMSRSAGIESGESRSHAHEEDVTLPSEEMQEQTETTQSQERSAYASAAEPSQSLSTRGTEFNESMSTTQRGRARSSYRQGCTTQ